MSANSTQRSFALVPFSACGIPAGLNLEGTVARTGEALLLHYRLSGPLQELLIPAPAASAERRDGLWQTTCFEAFLAEAGSETYWELNLSPAGHWNLYRLDGYRKGLAPEAALSALPLQLGSPQPAAEDLTQGLLELQLELPLPPALAGAGHLELAITAVLQQRDLSLSYWALAHPGPEPDFHRRDGFLLEL
ncbi:MAG: DOMON-like domain-containing protein [Prochlorococcaceae cyanobacterium]